MDIEHTSWSDQAFCIQDFLISVHVYVTLNKKIVPVKLVEIGVAASLPI